MYCINCRYCRENSELGYFYCKQTYTIIDLESGACESFVENNDDY